MKVFPGPEAWANLISQNPFSRWNTAPQDEAFARTANARMDAGAFVADYRTAIRMKPGDRVFCIGSCFARNVESALRQGGIDVDSGRRDASDEAFDTFNIYNTASMLNELRWALDPAAPFDPAGFLKGPDGYLDPHTSLAAPGSLEQCTALRNSIVAVTRRAARCNFVVITLGLVEAWFDRDHGTYLNVAPPRALTLANPGRFELRVLDARENHEALEKILALLKRHCRPDMQLILTVSPVPFIATFSGQDVVTANTYSKSVLRAVAQEFADRHDTVQYVPIYESVMNSDVRITWEPDRIHVERDVVRLNVMNFLSRVLADGSRRAQAEKEVEELKITLAARSGDKAGSPAAMPVSRPPGSMPAAETPPPGGLPVFEAIDVGAADARAFPAGFPAITASSSADGLGPRGLMSGAILPWHAVRGAPFPHTIDLQFPRSLRCGRLWLQSQDRHPERAPTCFVLSGGPAAAEIGDERTFPLTHKWRDGSEWAGFRIAFKRDWKFFRLTILASDFPRIVTLQRLWLEPEGWMTA